MKVKLVGRISEQSTVNTLLSATTDVEVVSEGRRLSEEAEKEARRVEDEAEEAWRAKEKAKEEAKKANPEAEKARLAGLYEEDWKSRRFLWECTESRPFPPSPQPNKTLRQWAEERALAHMRMDIRERCPLTRTRRESASLTDKEAIRLFFERNGNQMNPVKAGSRDGRVAWVCRGWGILTEGVDDERGALLVREAVLKADGRLETLAKLAKLEQALDALPKRSREPIPDEVRMLVHRRDGGACVKCGAKEDLEYDHILPHSKGGATSANNLQILCRPCNRKKHASI
jgi:hypothetical protein